MQIRTIRAALTAALVTAALATPALGWVDPDGQPVTQSRFAAEGTVAADGLKIAVSGTAMCGATGVLQVAVSVLQQETLAAARGLSTEQACTAAGLVPFTAEIAVPAGKPGFAAGPVMACALAQTRPAPDVAADYDHWCVFVTLAVDAGM